MPPRRETWGGSRGRAGSRRHRVGCSRSRRLNVQDRDVMLMVCRLFAGFIFCDLATSWVEWNSMVV